METVSLPQQNLEGLDWRARNQLKFRNKVGSRFVPATSNPLLERLMAMASPERRRPSPEKTRSSRLHDHSSSSNPTKASAHRKQPLKASSKSKVGATSSGSTQQKRKRVILEDSESDDPLAGPHPKLPKRKKRIAGLSSKGSNREYAPVDEMGNGAPNSEMANALSSRVISKKDVIGLTHTAARSRRDQDVSSCIQDDAFVKKTNVATVRSLKSRAPGTQSTQSLVSQDDDEPESPPTKAQLKTTGAFVKATSKSKTLSKKGNEEIVGLKSPNLNVLLAGGGLRPCEDYDHGLDAGKLAPRFGEKEISSITTSYRSSATSRKPSSASALVKSDPEVCVVHPMKKRTKNPTSKASKKPPAAAAYESDLDSENAPLGSALAVSGINPATNAQPPNPPNPKMGTLSNTSAKSGGSKGPAARKPKVPAIPKSDDDSDNEPLIIPMPKKLKASTTVQGVSPPGRSRVAPRDDSIMQMQTLSRKVPKSRSEVLTKDHSFDPEVQASKKIAGDRFATTRRHDSSNGRSSSPEIPKIRSTHSGNTRKRKAAKPDDTDVGSDEEYSMIVSSSSATLVEHKTSSDERLARTPTKRGQISKRLSLVAIEAEVDQEAETLNKRADEVSFAYQTPADEKISEGRRTLRSANVKKSIEARAPILQNGQQSIATEMENNISVGPSKTVGMKARVSRLVSSNTPVGDALSQPIIPQTETSWDQRSSQMASRLGLPKTSSIKISAAKTTISRPRGPSSNSAARRKPSRRTGPPSEIDEMDLFAR